MNWYPTCGVGGALPEVVLAMSYFANGDYLVITSDVDALTGAESITLTIDGVEHDIVLPDFTVEDGFTITVPNASTYDVGGTLTQAIVYEDAATTVEIGTATANEVLTPVPVAIINAYNPQFADVANGNQSSSCANINTMDLRPMVIVQVDGMGGNEVYGVEVTWADATTQQFHQLNTSVYPYGIGYFAFIDSDLMGRQIDTIQLIDDTLTPYANVWDSDLYWVVPDSIIQAGTDITIDLLPQIDGPLVEPAAPNDMGRLTLTGCTQNGGAAGNVTVFPPGSPNVGLNPVGMTIVQWDMDAIILEDVSTLTFPVDIVRIAMESGSPHFEGRVSDYP